MKIYDERVRVPLIFALAMVSLWLLQVDFRLSWFSCIGTLSLWGYMGYLEDEEKKVKKDEFGKKIKGIF